AAAAKARRFTSELYVGDVLSAPFAAGRFDVVSAFHVLEHVPDPVAVLRRLLHWLPPRGTPILEVANAGRPRAAMFGTAGSGLERPRHLSHFSPATLRRAAEQAGGRVDWIWHGAKPRYYLWSLAFSLQDGGWSWLARATQWRPIYGALKLLLELTLPPGRGGPGGGGGRRGGD